MKQPCFLQKTLSWSLLLLTVGGLSLSPAKAAESQRPNVLVILADDLGYSDIGAFGSEISTPNLDALAAEGRVLTNMHVTPLCATTRAQLLTGVDHHLVNVGMLPGFASRYPGAPNYTGQLGNQAPTIAQLLKDAGYHTYMAGKWHLGSGGPVNFGFEQSFSLAYDAGQADNYAKAIGGAAQYVEPYYENGVQVGVPDDFFSSDYYTDKLIQYIDSQRGDGRPFFGYLAFQAVHIPLQVPQKWITPYRGRYDAGYDAIREARLAKQKELGIVAQDFIPNPADEQLPIVRYGETTALTEASWNSLSAADRQSEARVMEVFAGMLTNMDANIGRLLQHLKEIGQYDNTFIVFLADNGAEGNNSLDPDAQAADRAGRSLESYGSPGSLVIRGTRWAQVASLPLRRFKAYSAEGGIASASIVRLPSDRGGLPNHTLASVSDLLPTLLDAAGVAAPGTTYRGTAIVPLEGASLLPALNGQQPEVHDGFDVFADEVGGSRYVRRGPWKLTRFSASLSNGQEPVWQLFNLDQDRGENFDVIGQHPGIATRLLGDWDAYVKRVGVVEATLPPGGSNGGY